MENVLNYEEVKNQIEALLTELESTSTLVTTPKIYHLDVAAMYPNIILTNRLQPSAIVDDATCAACDFNKPDSNCQRPMIWSWRGEYFTAKRNEYKMIKNQLENEKFPHPKFAGKFLSFSELSVQDQSTQLRKRLSNYCRKVYKKIHDHEVVERTSTVCQRENSFYINTVRSFRDRRYDYKDLHKIWKKKTDEAVAEGDVLKIEECKKMQIVYDSLQLAHKCILNSFYGYVMRKGARWYSMEMAGIVCHTGANIITLARQIVERIGQPLELDTDGIWAIFPSQFPENYTFQMKDGKNFTISYPCTLLNHLVHDKFTNHQYQVAIKEGSLLSYKVMSENSIFFEVDGPYRAMILPSSKEEDKLLKKRYAVFNDDGSLAELKGFEVKRRGELKMIKIFQTEIFSSFLHGSTLTECYASVAEICNQFLDILHSKGQNIEVDELIDLISENRSMSRSLEEYGDQKSTSISTAKRLAEFLGDEMVKDKGLACKFVISAKPIGDPVASRAVPVAIFSAEESVKRHFLRKWLKDSSLSQFDVPSILDWSYYIERIESVIQKLIVIPAAMQMVPNPVPRVKYPDWLQKRTLLRNSSLKQSKMNLTVSSDIEDISERFLKPKAKALPEIATVEIANVLKTEESVISCSVFDNYAAWIKRQKKLWKKQKIARDTKIKAGSYSSKNSKSLSSFLSSRTSDFQKHTCEIIQISATNKDGLFNVWYFAGNGIHSFPLSVPRIFYVNSKVEDPSSTYKRVFYTLPRRHPSYFLYEFSLPEEEFKSDSTRFHSFSTHHQIAGVYEMQVPLLFRAILQMGVNAKLTSTAAATKSNEKKTFTINDFDRKKPTATSYLKSPSIKHLYFAHIYSESRSVTLCCSSEHYSCRVWIVDPAVSKQLPNLKSLMKERLAQAQLTSENENDAFTNFMNFNFDSSYHSNDNALQKEVSKYFASFDESRRHSHIAICCSSLSNEDLCIKFPMLSRFPLICDGTHQPSSTQYNFSSLDWQRSFVRKLLDNLLAVNAWLSEKLSLARYCEVPIGNLPSSGDSAIAVCDVLMSRLLKENGCVLWYADPQHRSMPDLGGLEADEFAGSGSGSSDPNLCQQICNASLYNSCCIEFSLGNLAVNSLLVSSALLDVEGCEAADFSGADQSHSVDQMLMLSGSKQQQQQQAAASHMLANDQCSKSVLVIYKAMLLGWCHDLKAASASASSSSSSAEMEDCGQLADWPAFLLVHFWRFLASSSLSALYDAAIVGRVQWLMNKVFLYLIKDIQQLGCEIIFATWNRIIVKSKKEDFDGVVPFVDYLMKQIKGKELYQFLQFEPVCQWKMLLWLDNFNYAGRLWQQKQKQQAENAEEEEEEIAVTTTAHSKWKIIKFLPPVMQSMAESLLEQFCEYVCNRGSNNGSDKLLRDQSFISKATHSSSSSSSQIFQDAEDMEDDDIDDELSGNGKKLPYELASKFLSTISDLQRLYSVTAKSAEAAAERQMPLYLDSIITPAASASASSCNAILEFAKFILTVFSLDAQVEQSVKVLRKQALTLLGVGEFSSIAEFKLPYFAFSLWNVTCEICSHCQDFALSNSNSSSSSSSQQWLCEVCGCAFDKHLIEGLLLQRFNEDAIAYELQDLSCIKCRGIKQDLLQPRCKSCCSPYGLLKQATAIQMQADILLKLAKAYDMPTLAVAVTPFVAATSSSNTAKNISSWFTTNK